MNTTDSILDDDNAHVQELKRLFLCCDVDENQCLGRNGLRSLCERLKLSEHSQEIADRVLCGADSIDFYNFKERFVSFLPEIIDVSSGTVDPLVSRAQQTAQALGFANVPTLTRYETRLLCENTDELEQLSVIDINGLFERADSDRSGRVTVQQFLSQYRLQKRLSAEVHFIADSYVSSLNLFQSLDPNGTGSIDSHVLMESWNKAGLRIDEGIAVLKESGQPMSGPLNGVYLSGFLETELSQAAAECPVAVKAAIVSLHCCIDHLRCVARESDSRADHLQKQLQLANQRRTLLIEELEHNQLSIEQGYEKRLRETEERYRSRLIQMEDKFRLDKRDLQNEIENVEEELSKLRQQEVSSKNKLMLMERQSVRLNEETREQAESLSQLEQLNRQLRTELSKAMQPRPVEDNTQLIMWKQKVDLLVAHNKRLREKIQELTIAQKKKNRGSSEMDALTAKWSSAFKNQVLMIRKRRMARGDTLSEMDSEPESIFVRHKRRRLLKRGERKRRHERIQGRLGQAVDSDESSSTTLRRDQQQLAQRMEEQLMRLKEDHKKEITVVRQAVSKTLADALNDQEKQMTSQFERERRQMESRLTSEKNQLERAFAEEKMKLMNRLQEDFDTELKRIASMVNRPESAATVEQYKRQIKVLETSLEGQKNGYEKRLTDLRDKYKTSQRAQNSTYHIDKNTTNFISLIEKYRNTETAPSSTVETSRSFLGVEKRPPSSHQPFQRSLSSMSARCEKCDLADSRLRELYHVIAGDQTSAESGFEDIGSSAGGNQNDDKMALKREIRRLKGRLEAAKEKVSEWRVVVAMGAGQRYKGCLGGLGGSEGNGDWRRSSTPWSEATTTAERLESEKVILEARLGEAQVLIKSLVEQYKQQLDETARLGGLLKEVYAHPLENSQA